MQIAFFGDSLTEGKTGVSYFEILKEKLPQHKLFNFGRGGDTVASLYRRISGMNFNFDIAFLWIGTNDVLSKVTSRFSVIKMLKHQPPAENVAEFERYYQKLIDCLTPKTKKIIAVSPLFIGENLNNQWNRQLAELVEIIKNLSYKNKSIDFLNLREQFATQLVDRKISDYHIRSITRVILDYLFLRTPEKVDRKAGKRGLYFTLDGVHLNSIGARFVANSFCEIVKNVKIE